MSPFSPQVVSSSLGSGEEAALDLVGSEEGLGERAGSQAGDQQTFCTGPRGTHCWLCGLTVSVVTVEPCPVMQKPL